MNMYELVEMMMERDVDVELGVTGSVMFHRSCRKINSDASVNRNASVTWFDVIDLIGMPQLHG